MKHALRNETRESISIGSTGTTNVFSDSLRLGLYTRSVVRLTVNVGVFAIRRCSGLQRFGTEAIVQTDDV